MKIVVTLLMISLLLSACSISNNSIDKAISDFSVEEESENFELEFEETFIERVDADLSIKNIPKKFARFTDYEIGFSFLYPDNDKITQDKVNNYIMIKNHETSKQKLDYGDFYIKISYYENKETCKSIVKDISSIYELNGIIINRGYGSSEIGGIEYNLCFEKKGKTIKIIYTENGISYVNTIFNTLQFE